MARVATLVVAVWLLLTGWRVAYLAQAFPPQYLVGFALAVAEVVALKVDAVRWFSLALGVWLVAAPLALGYPGPLGALNSFLCGLVVVVLALHPTEPASYGPLPTMQRQLFAGHGGGKPTR